MMKVSAALAAVLLATTAATALAATPGDALVIADNGRVARIILVSTALAFVTFSGAVALLV